MVELNKNYDPTKDKEYMSELMLEYFRQQLLEWRQQLKDEAAATIKELQANSAFEADPSDQASLEYGQAVELRTRDRERKLITKIDEAIDRIDEGDFGYCTETDEPIGVKRLMARPIATLCIEAKEAQEKEENSYAK
ncbi:MAG: RNA polymerase-binding transcription factor DksA [Proteobacteria bacterium]|nr:MAG: RNA polymerase-binding transcription factor DksA [Pseudomonadota bacterium]